jgi:hypothetical protein
MSIKPTKRNILLILFSLILIAIVIYTSTAQYSISEITPDNYKTNLKKINASLNEAGIDQVIPEKFLLSSANKYLTSDNFRNNGIKITNTKIDNGNHVEIHSTVTQLNYWITFEKGNFTQAYIFKQALMDPNSPPTPFIKEIVNNLILKNGFLLKRTELKNGSDFIIKETDNCFIIGSFYSYDSQEPVSNITFSTFSKKKLILVKD